MAITFDKKGIKVFGSQQEAAAEVVKLQGHGFNAHIVGKLVKISDKGEGPPKLPAEIPKTVKVGKDIWLASSSGYAMSFEDKDEALVITNKLRQQGYKAVAFGLAVLMPEASAGPKVDFTYHEKFHTKKGHPIFVTKLTEQVDKATYNELLAGPRSLEGITHPTVRVVPFLGFTFKSENAAKQFMAAAKQRA